MGRKRPKAKDIAFLERNKTFNKTERNSRESTGMAIKSVERLGFGSTLTSARRTRNAMANDMQMTQQVLAYQGDEDIASDPENERPRYRSNASRRSARKKAVGDTIGFFESYKSEATNPQQVVC